MGYRYLISAVLVTLTLCVAATAVAADRAKDREGDGAFTSAELQAAMMSFADSWSSQIAEATTLLARQMGTPQAHNQANSFGYYTIAAAIDIAAGFDPGAALLDMLVLVTLSRMVWEEHWMPQVYGQSAAGMLTTLRKLEEDIWALAAKVLTPTQRQELLDVLRAWRTRYPDKIRVSFIRFSDFGELGRKPSLEAARKAGGLLAPIKHAAQAADEIRILGERALYVLKRMQELMHARTKLLVQDLLTTPEIAQLLADVTGFREVSERYAEIFEALPAQLTEQTRVTIDQTMAQVMRQSASLLDHVMQQVSAERHAIMSQSALLLDHVMQQVSAERHATIEQVMRVIAQEYQVALAQLQQGVSQERQALLGGIEQVLDRGERRVEQGLAQGFVLLAALILIFFVVRLAYRYAADPPVGTPSWRWAACAGLGGLALLVLVTGLAYVQRGLPPMSATPEAQRAAHAPVDTSPAPDARGPLERPAKRHGVAVGGQGVEPAPDTTPGIAAPAAPPGSATTPATSGPQQAASAMPALLPGQAAQLRAQRPSRIATIRHQGRLTVAVQEDFKPFSFLDAHQQRVGFEVDLIRELAKRWLGDTDAVTFVPVTPDRRIATLLEGTVDLIAAALTNTPARQKQIAFSHTYFQDKQRLLVPEGAAVADVCDLQGKIIAVTRGSTAVDNVRAQARACGFTAQLLDVETQAEAVAAVLMGKAAAFRTEGLALEQLAAGKPLKVVRNSVSEEPYGLGLPQGDEAFRRVVNLTLEAMYADGTLAAMSQKWFQDSARPYPLPAFNKDTAAPELVALATTNVPPVFPPVQGHPSPARQYVVQKGDTLSRIAGRVYGDVAPQAWKRIYDVNKAVIGADPAQLRMGMRLTIPES